MNTRCDQCNRKAKYSYPVAGSEQANKCGYHTWWHGAVVDSDYLNELRNEYRLEVEN